MPARKNTQDRTCILVMGMHRSGTSALGGVLGLLGNDLPSHIIGGDENNQKGYFESAPLNTLNSDIMEALGRSWHDWRTLDVTGDFPGRADFESRARVLLEQEFGAAVQFVFKDPRNCRLGDFWLPLLREQGCRIVALHTLRNPWEVAASLSRRDKMLPEQGLLLWLRHTLDAERLTRGLPRYHTSYDLLMQDWRGVVEKSGPALGLIWKRSPKAAAEEINAFLTRDLRHFEMAPPTESAAWAWVRATHEILRAWSLTGEVEADHARLDEIRHQFDAAEPTLEAMLSAATARQARLQALEDDAAELSARAIRAENERHTISQQLVELQIRTDGVRRVDLEHLEAINADLMARLKLTESALQQRMQESEDQHRELFKLRQLYQDHERRVRLEEEARHQRDVMDLKARYAHSLNQAQTASEELRQAQAHRDQLAARLPVVERDLQKALAERTRYLNDAKAVRSSTSWRITAPLRRVISVLRRKKSSSRGG